jgi:hypothetical protein
VEGDLSADTQRNDGRTISGSPFSSSPDCVRRRSIDREVRSALTGLGENDSNHEIAVGDVVKPDAVAETEAVGLD